MFKDLKTTGLVVLLGLKSDTPSVGILTRNQRVFPLGYDLRGLLQCS